MVYHQLFRIILVLALLVNPVVFGKILDSIRIDSTEGRALIKSLQDSMDLKNTTTARREKKIVIRKTALKAQLKTLKKSSVIKLLDRDKMPQGGVNKTFTFYGQGFYFKNFGIKTKIKLRSRFYLQSFEHGRKQARSPDMQDWSFLEIKVKNPSPEALDSVHKYRAKIKDEDLICLFQLDSTDQNFAKELMKLEKRVIAFSNQKKQANMIHSMFMAIKFLANISPRFIRPELAISYDRKSKKFDEKNYKIKRFLRRTKKIPEVEYQLTIDTNVLGYTPHLTFEPNFNFQDYFQKQAPADIVFAYPNDAVVIEVKLPIEISNLLDNKKSLIHKHWERFFVNPLFNKEALYPGFMLNKGKFGTLRSKIFR